MSHSADTNASWGRRIGAVLLIFTGTLARGVEAQSATGAIAGRVVDGAGQPVSGVVVGIAGRSIEAATGPGGLYRLTYVPAGSFTLRVRPPHGASFDVEAVLVRGGEVRRVDIDLSVPGAIEAPNGSIAAPLSSSWFVRGDDVDRLPIGDPVQALLLQPGVAVGRNATVTLRGSRPDETALFVDGVPVRSMDHGGIGVAMAPNALAEASVRTGPLGSDWGDAQAGAISLVTAGASTGLSGALAYESDALQGTSGRAGFQWLEASVGWRPIDRFEVFAGGVATTSQAAELNRGIQPLPIYTYESLDTVLMLPTGGGIERSDTTAFDIPLMVQYGGDCPASGQDSLALCYGRRRPRAWNSDSRWNARARYDLGGGSALTVSALAQARQSIDWTWTMNRDGRPGTRSTAAVFIGDWVQRLVSRPGASLTLHATISRQSDRTNRGAVTDVVSLDASVPSLGRAFDPLDFAVNFDAFAPGDPSTHLTRDSTGGYVLTRLGSDEDWDAAIENVRYNRGTRRSYLGRDDLVLTTYPRLNPYGVVAPYINAGLDFGQTMVDERRTFARAVIDWQARRFRLRAGAETTRGRVGHWESDWTSLAFATIYTASPRKTGAFLDVEADVGVARLDAGLRLDWFDAGLTLPLVPGRTFTHPAFRAGATPEELTCPATADVCDASSHVWVGSRTYRTLSPTLRAVFPVGRRTSFRIAYAHQVQAPPLSVLAAGSNNDVSVAGSDGLFGGDVAPSRTVHYEAGAHHTMRGGLALDAAAYYKDLQQQLAYRFAPIFDPVLDSTVSRRIATNADFGSVRGLDVRVGKRWGDWLSLSVAYGFVAARSTGSDPTDYVFGLAQMAPPEGVDTLPPLDNPARTRDERTHQVSGTALFQVPAGFREVGILGTVLADVGAYVTFRSSTGWPYTRFENVGNGVRSDWTVLGPLRAIEELRGSTTGWQNNLDLRVVKGFTLGRATIEVYGDFRNLLGLATTPIVFAETGGDTNALLRDRLVRPQLDQLWDEGYLLRTTIQKTDPDGSNPRTVNALDLRDVSTACPQWWGTGGTVACVMVQRTERRFGNGDGYFDVEEQEAAVTAWYASTFSAAHFAGPGRSIRIGVRASF